MTEAVAIGSQEKQSLPNTEALLNEFRRSKSFHFLREKAMDFYLAPRSTKELADFTTRLPGAVFEELSFIYFRYKHQYPERVIPPQQVVRFYQNLFPKAVTAAHTLGRNSLKEISVPDVIVINSDKIVIIYECTLDPTRDNLDRKFQALQKNKKKFPERFPDTRFAVVVPQDTKVAGSEDPKIDIEPLPLTDRQFRDFLKEYIYYGRSTGIEKGTVAGVFDIRDRMKDQTQRHLDALLHGKDISDEATTFLFHMFGESKTFYLLPDSKTVYTYESSRHN